MSTAKISPYHGPLEVPLDTPDAKGYALSGKIMLSAIIVLFAVVVVMVCLHVYARWYLLRARRRQISRRGRRRTHLVFYVEPDNPASIVAVPTRGLDASVLDALPTFTFNSKGDKHDAVLECAVCLSEFENGENGRLLPKCNHSFHTECIDMWFHTHSTCPLCRSPVDVDSPPVKTVDEGVLVEGDPTDHVVVEMADLSREESNQSDAVHINEVVTQPESSSADAVASPSLWARRKKVELEGVEIQVPRRAESFNNLEELGASSPFKSPTSRLLSLKRILNRDKRPLPSPSGIGTSCCAAQALTESDIEQGRVEPDPSRTQTPR